MDEGEFVEADDTLLGGGGPAIIPCNWSAFRERGALLFVWAAASSGRISNERRNDKRCALPGGKARRWLTTCRRCFR
jgi:hypothetical protein